MGGFARHGWVVCLPGFLWVLWVLILDFSLVLQWWVWFGVLMEFERWWWWWCCLVFLGGWFGGVGV